MTLNWSCGEDGRGVETFVYVGLSSWNKIHLCTTYFWSNRLNNLSTLRIFFVKTSMVLYSYFLEHNVLFDYGI